MSFNAADALREFCETVHHEAGEDGVLGITVSPRVFEVLAKASGIEAAVHAAGAREFSIGNVLVRKLTPAVFKLTL